MEIMTKVICPYCKEWLDIESFLTMDDLKNECTYKECYVCNKHFSLYLKTNIHAKAVDIETEIEDLTRSIELFRKMDARHPLLKNARTNEYCKKVLEKLYKLQKENEKK
jgi:telomere resolvase resT